MINSHHIAPYRLTSIVKQNYPGNSVVLGISSIRLNYEATEQKMEGDANEKVPDSRVRSTAM
jgi:hypothetical protein